jgi:GT2 family glycosyltransferase
MRFGALLNRLLPHRAVRRIVRSALFDEAYYAASYADVNGAAMTPARHYLEIGAGELRNSSPRFEARSLLRLHPAFRPGRDNPALFLEERCKARGSILPDAASDKPLHIATLLDILEAGSAEPAATHVPQVDVIVPVHNNLASLHHLLRSLARHTAARHTIILIDDASSEAGISDALSSFADSRRNAVLITNRENTGFAASANLGLRHSANHKIILNSDTVVPAGWVDTLIEPIVRERKIASVTPYSNASSYTGFPENRIELPFAGDDHLRRVNDALSAFPALDRDIVSGVGFCMALNSAAVDAIGEFDEASFRQGYYEETQWCYRAKHAGYRNVLANRLCVGHDHASASFGLKRKLAALGRSERKMRRDFPGYFEEMEAFYYSDPHQELRLLNCLIAASRTCTQTTVLFENETAGMPASAIEDLAAAATAAGAVLIWAYRSDAAWKLTVFTPDFGAVRLAGNLNEVCQLLPSLGVKKILCGASQDAETVRLIGDFCARAGIALTRLRDAEVAAARDAAASARTDRGTAFPPEATPTPASLHEWRALAAWPEQTPPFCIAVLGTPPLRRHPRELWQLIDYVVRENKDCRILVFGEMPDDQLNDPRVSKTGIYRFENIPALLRHHGVAVAYFPRTRHPSFAATCRDVLSMGLRAFSHDTGAASSLTAQNPRWTVQPASTAKDTFDALERIYLAHLERLRLPIR